MKAIEALKKIKNNRAKITDLTTKIMHNTARLSSQTSPYGDVGKATEQVTAWMDAVRSLIRDNEVLTNRLHRTNATTLVTIDIGGRPVVKSIDEWITRRKEGVAFEKAMYKALTDRALKEELIPQPDGTRIHVTIVRHYDPVDRDNRLSVLSEEVSLIDSALEIVNATTDLVE